MKRPHARPQLEALSARVLPSATAPALPAPAFAPAQSPARPTLSGHADGSYTTAIVGVDSGAAYTFQGSAALNGQAGRVTGTIQSVGLLAQGHASGSLTFTRGHDHVTLQVTGPAQPSFSPLPTTFSYKVVEATGAYQPFLSQQGLLTLNLSTMSPQGGQAARKAFVLSFAPLPSSLAGQARGTYTTTIVGVDSGAAYTFQGAASLPGLGSATLSGTVQSVGLIVGGHANGTLTLTLGHDHITLAVTGPAQRSFAPLPTAFSYKVVEATGAYQPLLSAQGSLRLSLTAPVPLPGPGAGLRGSFWLAFDSLR